MATSDPFRRNKSAQTADAERRTNGHQNEAVTIAMLRVEAARQRLAEEVERLRALMPEMDGEK